jgi:hypothetical protein
MKKFFLIISVSLITLLGTETVFAQSIFKKEDKVGQVGLGLGFGGIYGSVSFPPISFGFQYGIHEKISVGGIIGYTSSTEKVFFARNYEWKYSYIVIGARGEYHFLENIDKVDGYAGATLGYNIVSVSEPTGFGGTYSASGSYLLFGVHVGGRYYFNPQIAAFAELGYGLGYLTAGVAFKL